jgi:plasmid replication initiation protein
VITSVDDMVLQPCYKVVGYTQGDNLSKRPSPRGDQQPDLFAACFADIPVRDQRETMERPFFSLAKRPRFTPIEYHVGDVWVKVSPNVESGMATIWDADILIWAATQLTEAMDQKLSPGRNLKFHPYNLLKGIRRGTSGRDYEQLRASLRRLAATYVETNIRATGKKRVAGFHWIEGWTEIADETTRETIGMTMTLPDWFCNGVMARGGVLTIHEDYFLLTGGIERWLYRVGRKHAGHQECGWQLTMRQLYDKSGSMARFSDFALDVRRVVQADGLPEYHVSLHKNAEGEEVVSFLRRSRLAVDHPRFEAPRFSRRRIARGMFAEPLLS